MNESRVSRVAATFERLARSGRGGLVTFLTAGDPDPDSCYDLIAGLPEAGADIIELGMPFSDPMADGPTVQCANQRALANGATTERTLRLVERFRAGDADTPVVLMGYYNPIYQYGPERFVTDARSLGVDGLIIVDLPPEEDVELCHPALAAGLHWIRLVTPTTTDARLTTVLRDAGGFVYFVSIAGITGTRSAATVAIDNAVERLRRHTAVPIAVGFGIRTAEQAASVSRTADAAVVGSALIERIESHVNAGGDRTAMVAEVHRFVAELAAGVRRKG